MRIFLLLIGLLLALDLSSQEAYWLSSGRAYKVPAKKRGLGLTLRTFTGKDPVPDLNNQQADFALAQRIISRKVVMPAPPWQVGLKLQPYLDDRFFARVELFWDFNRDQVYYDKHQNLQVTFPARDWLQQLGLRLDFQVLTKLGSVYFNPLLTGGLMYRSEGFEFHIHQSLNEPDKTWQSVQVSRVVSTMDLGFLDLFFVGAGVETPLFALPSQNHTHGVSIELLVQRYWHRVKNYSLLYENSAGEHEYYRMSQGGGWWVFSVGLNYSFFYPVATNP